MTELDHVREAEVHYVDTETCAHRLLPVSTASQCPKQPEHLVTGIPVCGGHLAMVVRDQYARGNPDPVVRRWV